MKRTFKSFLALTALALTALGASLIASPAQAQTVPTCTLKAGSLWPANTNFYTCFTPLDNNRVSDILSTIQSLPARGAGDTADKWWDVMKSQGVKIYYFKNRTAANAYFNRPNIPMIDPNPYAGLPNGVFSSTTAKCAQTGYHAYDDIFGNHVQDIAIAMYDECTLPSGQVASPQLSRATTHEAAHAYDFAIKSKRTSNRTGTLSNLGFGEMLTYDINHLIPTGWATKTPAQKDQYLCIWDSSLNVGTMPSSALEQALGATTAGSICSGGTALAPYKWTGTTGGKDPLQIAQEKIPYFIMPLDAWAEGFAIRQAGIGDNQGANFLRLTDHIMGWENLPDRAFKCTRLIIDSYVVTGKPPTITPTNQFTAAGCPTPTGALQ